VSGKRRERDETKVLSTVMRQPLLLRKARLKCAWFGTAGGSDNSAEL
jgi:hypothetical protein